jgi:type VII secretion-associated serine protease mycosin
VLTRLTHHSRSAAPRALGAALFAVALAVTPVPATPVPAGGGGGVALPLARTDEAREQQWQLERLRATEAWRYSTGVGVTVAVIDSGVDGKHGDLVGQVLPGNDFVMLGGDGRMDPVGHGTTVAGLIAGRNDDSNGVVGLAPGARILPVRVLDDENRYDDALVVAKAVRWAVDNGAKVINLSLGGAGESPQLAAALDYAFARDVVVVACTGNISTSTGPPEVWYPAREPGVIAVGGLDEETDGLWPGSITGDATVLTAPAVNLVGARPGGFWRVQGTSFAAPLVSATAALVRSRYPKLSAGDVVNRMLASAKDLGQAGRDEQFGFGAVDPVGALTREVPEVGTNPLDDDLSPGEAGFGPAPGASAAPVSGGGGPGQFGADAASHTAWEALPAGSRPPPGSHPGRLVLAWLFVIALVAATAVVRLRPLPAPAPARVPVDAGERWTARARVKAPPPAA